MDEATVADGAGGAGAVSYTHLDVYKRQVQASPGGSSGFLSSAGLDQVRQVEFTVQGALPSLPGKAAALKLSLIHI